VAQTSVIAAGTQLSGRLTCGSDLHLEGRFTGEIVALGRVTISAGARVEGPLRARSVAVSGEVHGPVQAEEGIEILRGGSIAGDLSSACVVLAEGSDFRGRIDVVD
jgi:cytoskeletal protein CcmA (bactofilin family)